MQTPRRRALTHITAGAFFCALAVWLTYPLAANLHTHIPGEGAGDNLTFLWNVWWFQEWAQGRAASLFVTDRLFAPHGTSLVLHTHTVLPSALAYLIPLASVAAKHNLALLVGLALNGIATYWLAFRQVQSVVPSLAAGVLFASGGYVGVHLLGHFNLAHAWVLPLALVAWMRFFEAPSAARGVALGVAVAALMYTDYYYTVYAMGIFAIWQAYRSWTLRVSTSWRSWTVTMHVLVALILAAACLLAAIGLFGDLSFDMAGSRVSLRNTRNPLTVLYVLIIALALYGFRPRLHLQRKGAPSTDAHVLPWSIAVLTTIVLTAPILIGVVELLREGGYVAPRILWRSSPPGVDFATVFLGHPWHAVMGDGTRSLTERLSIDLVEQSAWVGLVALFAIGLSRPGSGPGPWSVWVPLAIAFSVLAAGPFFRFAGVDTGLPLPWALLRYVPLLSNARIPGRAMVVVALAVALLFALALTRLRPWARAAVLAALACEVAVRPVPLYELPQADVIDRVLREDPRATAVVELPGGIRDGFGEIGRFDHRALVHQTFHGRPLIGGFVARLSPRILESYRGDPAVMALLELPATPAATVSRTIPFVVLNTDMVREPDRVRGNLLRAGYRLILTAGHRELYGGSLDTHQSARPIWLDSENVAVNNDGSPSLGGLR